VLNRLLSLIEFGATALHKLEIIDIDGELGFVLPAEMIEAMSLKEGSLITATVDSHGILLESADDQPSLPARG
jgi:hypothetical protein